MLAIFTTEQSSREASQSQHLQSLSLEFEFTPLVFHPIRKVCLRWVGYVRGGWGRIGDSSRGRCWWHQPIIPPSVQLSTHQLSTASPVSHQKLTKDSVKWHSHAEHRHIGEGPLAKLLTGLLDHYSSLQCMEKETFFFKFQYLLEPLATTSRRIPNGIYRTPAEKSALDCGS